MVVIKAVRRGPNAVDDQWRSVVCFVVCLQQQTPNISKSHHMRNSRAGSVQAIRSLDSSWSAVRRSICSVACVAKCFISILAP